MGSIIVGQKKQKTVDMGVLTIAPNVGATVENGAGMMPKEETVRGDVREKRLAEIMALPSDEQLPLLLEEGFTEEAQKLSEDLAHCQQECIDEGSGEENQGQEAPVDGTFTDLTEESKEESLVVADQKKNVDRPKKSGK